MQLDDISVGPLFYFEADNLLNIIEGGVLVDRDFFDILRIQDILSAVVIFVEGTVEDAGQGVISAIPDLN